MRLWSLHPKYLDAKGLVALWREGLLAQAVLMGRTRGYKHHPQLQRFREHAKPIAAIRAYLQVVWDEAERRGYRFDRSKIGRQTTAPMICVTTGQMTFEYEHLVRKLRRRDPSRYVTLSKVSRVECHPLFKRVRGKMEPWEKV